MFAGHQPGDVARYACEDGHVLIGQSERVCQDDFTWSGSGPYCKYQGKLVQ